MTQRFDKSELTWTDSDYLCLFCYEPLYYNVITKKDVCTNPKCFISQTHPKIFVNIDKNPLLDQMKQKYLKRVKRFYIFSSNFLFRRLYETRMVEFIKFFRNVGMKFNDIIGIDFLLTKLYYNKIWGNETNEQIFQNTLNKFLNDFGDLEYIENLESKLYLIDQNSNPYIMKYNNVIVDIHKVLGLVDSSKYGPEDVNSFYFIDRKSRVGKASGPFDIETLFKNHFNLAIVMNHIFKFGYFVSQIHSYPVQTSHLATLFSVWTTCEPGKTCTIDLNGLKVIHDGAVKKNNLKGNFDDFLQIYTSGQKYAPILIFDGEKYHFDYATLFLILFYLFSINKTIEGTQKLSGYNTLMQQRQKAAQNFEIAIREKFRKEGFTVFPTKDTQKFEPKINGEQREFDCIAIDYSKKIIVSIDAKYEDMAPSSTVGETILEQAVLDSRNGILKHAKDHHTRRKFLIKTFNKLPLNLQGNFWEYKIYSLVVTKHKPMISKHLTSQIISFDEFKDIDFLVYGNESH